MLVLVMWISSDVDVLDLDFMRSVTNSFDGERFGRRADDVIFDL